MLSVVKFALTHARKRSAGTRLAENNTHDTKWSYVKSIEMKTDKCKIHRQKCSMSTCWYALIHCPKEHFFKSTLYTLTTGTKVTFESNYKLA